MIAAGLIMLGFFALAAAMPRHARVLLGAWEARTRPQSLRGLGWVLLAASLVAALWSSDWPVALVRWFGMLPLAAASVLIGLAYDARLARAAAAAGAIALVLGLLA